MSRDGNNVEEPRDDGSVSRDVIEARGNASALCAGSPLSSFLFTSSR